MKKFLLILLAVAVLGAGAAWSWIKVRGATPSAGYRMAKLERGPIASVVSSSGTLNAVVTVQVGSQISGQIRELHADFNSEVKRNQVIARIDPEVFEARLAQSSADVEAARSAVQVARSNVIALRAEAAKAQASLAEAERDYQRKAALVERNFISASERDKAQTAREIAREQLHTTQAQVGVQEAQVQNALALVKQRQAALAQARIDLERTYIRAPVDGTVISRNVDAGQTVAASLQAPTLFTIARDLTAMQVDTSVDEADIGRLQLGQTATFTVDAFPRRTFSGSIRQIRKAPTVAQNVVTYTVVISADNPDRSLLPGMTANVRIEVDRRDAVLKVPNAALRFRPSGAEASREARAEPGAAPGAAQAAQAFRQRLLSELNLDDAQKARVGAILDDARARSVALREMQNEAERRKHAERIRAESRTQIAEALTPAQRPAYERILAEVSGRSSTGRIWVLDAGGRPQAIEVRLGLADGSATEIVSGEVAEGREVIVGFAEANGPARVQGGPRMPL